MLTISKRSGQTEEFRRDKIVNSMRGAGITEQTARQVAAGIEHSDAMTTTEVRRAVIGAIKNKEPQAAKRYESHPRKVHKA